MPDYAAWRRMMTREVFWNVGGLSQLAFYMLSVLALAVFLLGVIRIAMVWRSAGSDRRRRDLAASAATAVLDSLLGRRIFRGDLFGGLAHLSIMWGWIFLFAGTVLLTIHHDLVPFLFGGVYLTYSLVLDAAGALFIVGALLAAYRRFVRRTNGVRSGLDDLAILVLLSVIAVTGFLSEGLRLASTGTAGQEWSPVGDLVAATLAGRLARAEAIHPAIWWLHALAALGLVAYIPFSKLFHMLAAPASLYMAGARPEVLTVEEREHLKGTFDLTQMISMDACTRCNRCETVCPAYAAGEPLSPRELVLSLKAYQRRTSAPERRWITRDGNGKNGPGIEEAVPRGECWYCTTCIACAERCPVGINPAEMAREVRAALLEGGRRVPKSIRDVLNTIGKHGNPWEASSPRRFAWLKSLEAKDIARGDSAELCYFVGSVASGDERNQDVARAMARVLTAAGVDFGVLGREEAYSGEDARRLGEDGLFEAMLESNYETLKEFEVTDLVTTSPHNLHTLSREYPALRERLKIDGAPSLSVRHHAELLANLLQEGRLRLSRRLEKVATYHDPCYLGRHTGIYDAPRQVLAAVPGLRLVEMGRNRKDSFCCGGGGGRLWMESDAERRISGIRVEEAARTGAGLIVTACPYCLSMLTDAVTVAGLADRIAVKDIAEVVAGVMEEA